MTKRRWRERERERKKKSEEKGKGNGRTKRKKEHTKTEKREGGRGQGRVQVDRDRDRDKNKAGKSKQLRTSGEELASLESPCSSAGGLAQPRHPPPQVCWSQKSSQPGSWQRRRKTITRVTEAPKCGSGEVHRRDSPLGHKAQGLESNVAGTSAVFSFALVGTEPLLVNAELKTETETRPSNHHHHRDDQFTARAASAHPAFINFPPARHTRPSEKCLHPSGNADRARPQRRQTPGQAKYEKNKMPCLVVSLQSITVPKISIGLNAIPIPGHHGPGPPTTPVTWSSRDFLCCKSLMRSFNFNTCDDHLPFFFQIYHLFKEIVHKQQAHLYDNPKILFQYIQMY